MLFLVILIAVIRTAMAQDLLGVSYFFDSNFPNAFSEQKCENTTQWGLVSYEHLEILPPYEDSSLAIRASTNSCTSSFPFVFLNGTLELTVYIRTVSKYSGLTITVFDELDDGIITARYQRTRKHFMTGWTAISLPITKHTTGYVQLSGQSLKSELVIIDSLRYIPDNSTMLPSDDKTNTSLQPTSSTIEANEFSPYYFEFEEINGSGDSEEEDNMGSGDPDSEGDEDDYDDIGSGKPTTEHPDSEDEEDDDDIGSEVTTTEHPDSEDEEDDDDIGSEVTTTEHPDSEDEDDNIGSEVTTTEHPYSEENEDDDGETTENPDEPETITDNPVSVEDTQDPEEPGFWNAFTITFVSVGGFFVIGTISVGSYFLGKNRSVSEIPPLDIEALEPESVITVPRVRSIFSDTPSERFSRFS